MWASLKSDCAEILETTCLAELPWATVQAVLKRVEALGHYTYAQLEYWYDANLLTVEYIDGSYLVTISIDGASDVVIIESM